MSALGIRLLACVGAMAALVAGVRGAAVEGEPTADFSCSFDSASTCTGWFESWGGDTPSSYVTTLFGSGFTTTSSISPYYGLAVKNPVTLAVVADVRAVAVPTTSGDTTVYRVIASFGRVTDGVAIVKTGVCSVALVRMTSSGVTVLAEASYTEVGTGYHLIIASYQVSSSSTVASIKVDDGETVTYAGSTALTAYSSAGFQLGGVYGGDSSTLVKGTGARIDEVRGYSSVLSEEEKATLYSVMAETLNLPVATLTLTADGEWSSEGSWVAGSTTLAAPLEGADVQVLVEGNRTLTMNASALVGTLNMTSSGTEAASLALVDAEGSTLTATSTVMSVDTDVCGLTQGSSLGAATLSAGYTLTLDAGATLPFSSLTRGSTTDSAVRFGGTEVATSLPSLFKDSSTTDQRITTAGTYVFEQPLNLSGALRLASTSSVTLNSNISATRLATSDASGAVTSLTQKGGTIVLSNTGTAKDTFAIFLGHWAAKTTYALDAGHLLARDGALQLGWDSPSVTLTVGQDTGDLALLSVKNFTGSRGQVASATILPTGVLELGSSGITLSGQTNKQVILAGGTLSTTADASITIGHANGLAITADSTIAPATGTTLTINTLSGSGALTVGGDVPTVTLPGTATPEAGVESTVTRAGTLDLLSADLSNYTGNITLAKGALKIPSSVSVPVTVGEGTTLTVSLTQSESVSGTTLTQVTDNGGTILFVDSDGNALENTGSGTTFTPARAGAVWQPQTATSDGVYAWDEGTNWPQNNDIVPTLDSESAVLMDLTGSSVTVAVPAEGVTLDTLVISGTAGSTIAFTGGTVTASAIAVNEGVTLTWDATSETFSGGSSLAVDGKLNLSGATDGTSVAVDALISGTGSVSLASGAVTLSAENSYTGGTVLAEGTTLTLGVGNAASTSGPISGSGTLIAPTGAIPGNTEGLSESSWTGTVVLSGNTNAFHALNLNTLGNASSFVELAGVTGYLAGASNTEMTLTPNLILSGEGWTSENGWTNTTFRFTGSLSGAGTLDLSGSVPSEGHLYQFVGDVADFTGGVLVDGNQRVVFGDIASQGNGTIGVAAEVTIASTSTWSAINGVIILEGGVLTCNSATTALTVASSSGTLTLNAGEFVIASSTVGTVVVAEGVSLTLTVTDDILVTGYTFSTVTNNGGTIILADAEGNVYPIAYNSDGAVVYELPRWTDPETGIVWYYTPVPEGVSLGIASSTTSAYATAVATSTTGDLVVPATVADKPVVAITSKGFYNCDDLTSVTLPETVTAIGSYAFYTCYGLTSMALPKSLSTIGAYAFAYCNSLTSVTLQTGLTSIGDHAFYYSELTSVELPEGVESVGASAFEECRALTSVVFSSGLTSIGASAFAYCTSLTSVTFPKGLESIENSAFYYCTSLASVTLQEGLTSIGTYAFYWCSSMTSVTFPKGLTSIGEHAFYFCSSLTSVTLPEGLTSLGTYAFGQCRNLTSVTLPEGLTTVSAGAFSLCSALTSVTLPEGLTRIGSYAFNYCYSLESVTLPEGLTSIGSYAFYNCGILTLEIPKTVTSIGTDAFARGALTSVTFYGDVITGFSATGVGITDVSIISYPEEYAANWIRVLYGENALEDASGVTFYYEVVTGGVQILYVDIPDDVVAVAFPDTISHSGEALSIVSFKEDLFKGNTVLQSVALPSALTTLPASVFSGCSALTSVTFPEGLTSIESSAFSRCSSLASLEFPETLTTIGSSAFSDCKALTSVVFPVALTNIGDYAFYRCTALESLKTPESLTTIGAFAFFSCTSLTSVTLSAGLTSIGEYAFWLCTSLTSVTLSEGLTSIGDYAFRSCTSLTTVTFPKGLSSIGSYAFSDCPFLTSATLQEGLTSIGEYAFWRCTSLTSVTLQEGLTSIGDYAFESCTSLMSVTFPKGLESIGSYAFSNCSSLTSVTLQEGLTSIGDYAYYNCSSLTFLMFPESLTTIGDAAFRNCLALPSITLPRTLTTLGAYAFARCTELQEVTLPNSLKVVENCAFSGCFSLEVLTVPASVTDINNSAFSSCMSLRSVTLSEGLTTIWPSAFQGCTSLVTLTLPSTLTSLGSDTFTGCTSLERVTFKGEPPSEVVASLSDIGLTPSQVRYIKTYASTWQESVTDVAENAPVVPITVDAGVTLTSTKQDSVQEKVEAQLSTSAADALEEIVVVGTQEAIDASLGLGISPAVTSSEASVASDSGLVLLAASTESSTVTATFVDPTMEVTAFDPTSGQVTLCVVPGEGSSITATPDTTILKVYGTNSLSEAMTLQSTAEIDVSVYTATDTTGTFTVTIPPESLPAFVQVVADP